MVYPGGMAETQMCLNCGENPAVPGGGTVPLCAGCKSQVNDKRGVKFSNPPKPEAPKDPHDPV